MFEPLTITIALAFATGFFIESVVGFGGGLVAYFFLSFFTDVKTMIMAGLYIGSCSSGYILATSYKSFNFKFIKNSLPLVLTGTIIGVTAFSYLPMAIISTIFAITLGLLAIRIIFFEKLVFNNFIRNKLMFFGGISQGAFGIGGPFWANALEDKFSSKSELRATMAGFFVIFNIARWLQLYFSNQLNYNFFAKIFWVIIPVFIAIRLGYICHLKISNQWFRKLIGYLTLFAAFKFIINLI